MAEKSIIIIGAGLAGLSAGCYAQMNGYRSRIFEHHTLPGGVVAAWKRKGYTIDGGIHFVWGHKPGQSGYELYHQLGISQANRFPDLTTYCRFINEDDGCVLEITRDLDRLAKELKALSPADAGIVDDLIAGARAMQGPGTADMGMSKPHELTGFLDRFREMWGMRRILKYFTGDYAKPVTGYVQGIQDPWLRWVIENLFLPEVPVWFVIMVLGMFTDGQLGLPEGGSLGIIQPIERRYKDLGGQVTYRATVEEILVENHRASGVRLADGSEHRADIVVSAADGHSTIFKMLGGRYVNEKIKNRYKNWKLFRPLVMVNFGVAREFTGEPCFTVMRLARPFTVGEQAVEGFFVRIFNYSPAFAPPGKAVIQVEFETEWDFWDQLQKEDRPRYDAEKERVAAEVLKRLEAHFPGLTSQVEVTDVSTPFTTWRYTRNHRGAFEGWLLTQETINTRVEKTLPGLANFYMAGQWVMPGGGILPCLYSGRHVVQILCHRDRKPFLTTIP
ncbi:MAG: NAD(P)/FAD-dependent oxidoreductase [Firmicutes bacterium]|nr:NAD(P)/FAD-dependent oxidoreductase [Bacillota bacterium]